jgi:hypothetical protein
MPWRNATGEIAVGLATLLIVGLLWLYWWSARIVVDDNIIGFVPGWVAVGRSIVPTWRGFGSAEVLGSA